MREKVVVHTNERDKPKHNLEIFGRVENFASIKPGSVLLEGPAGKEIKGQVRIIPKDKYPFEIVGIHLLRGKYVGYQLRKVEDSKGGGYVLSVENLSNKKGRYSDRILLKTTSTIRPELKIKVYGNIFSKEPRKAEP